MTRAVLVTAAALVAAAPAAAAPPIKTKRAEAAGVRAQITYRQAKAFSASDVRLRIVRRGKTMFDRKLQTQSVPVDLRVRDLDADSEPEVLADLYSGGPHCCTTSRLYRYEPAEARYALLTHAWGNVGYRLGDPDRDGTPEFMSLDDRFAYTFTAYAASFFPLQIWELRWPRLVDVTREYPEQVEGHAAGLWREYLRLRKKEDVRGVLAAYLADQYLLGRANEGWERLRTALRRRELGRYPDVGWPAGDGYLQKLRRFLVKTGYAR